MEEGAAWIVKDDLGCVGGSFGVGSSEPSVGKVCKDLLSGCGAQGVGKLLIKVTISGRILSV